MTQPINLTGNHRHAGRIARENQVVDPFSANVARHRHPEAHGAADHDGGPADRPTDLRRGDRQHRSACNDHDARAHMSGGAHHALLSASERVVGSQRSRKPIGVIHQPSASASRSTCSTPSGRPCLTHAQ